MKKVVITGADGFIGRALTEELVKNDVFVYAILKEGNLDLDPIFNSSLIKVIYCNLDRIYHLETEICEGAIDVFYHFAWDGGLTYAVRGDYIIQLNNIKYCLQCIETAQRLNCKKFIGAGSIMEIESHSFVPLSESKPSINYIYSTAKLTTFYMSKILASKLGIDFVWGRISNAYGAGEKSERFVNTILRQMCNHEHIVCTKGEHNYDFIYVTDVARAFYLLGLYGINGKSYYIGSGMPMPLKEFILLMKKISNSKSTIGFGEIDFNGVALSAEIFDATELKKDTGFEQQVNFEDGIKKMINNLV